MTTPGQKFRKAILQEKPLQIIGTINAYVAIMAMHTGYKAIYLSGAGVSNSSYGVPDVGLTTLDNVLEDVRRITDVVDVPLLVDIDTGWGSLGMVGRTIKSMINAKAAAVHIEDQAFEKRCGHLKGKSLVTKAEMVERISAAVDARNDPNFVIIARTDALAVEGFEKTVERALEYVSAGADMIFPEAFQDLAQYTKFRNIVNVPILANLTEFGQTPLFTTKELADAGVDMALYPLSANRAMNLAALRVLEEIKHAGTQKQLLEIMQSREELYGFLNYDYEKNSSIKTKRTGHGGDKR